MLFIPMCPLFVLDEHLDLSCVCRTGRDESVQQRINQVFLDLMHHPNQATQATVIQFLMSDIKSVLAQGSPIFPALSSICFSSTMWIVSITLLDVLAEYPNTKVFSLFAGWNDDRTVPAKFNLNLLRASLNMQWRQHAADLIRGGLCKLGLPAGNAPTMPI